MFKPKTPRYVIGIRQAMYDNRDCIIGSKFHPIHYAYTYEWGLELLERVIEEYGAHQYDYSAELKDRRPVPPVCGTCGGEHFTSNCRYWAHMHDESDELPF